MSNKKIYIILMNTGTIPNTIIRYVTKYQYGHVVLSLDNSYEKLYSFGRKHLNNFLRGGLVTYGINSEFFCKFKNTQCLIYELPVTNEEYKKVKAILSEYEKNMDIYKYDMKGLLIRYFYSKAKKRDNYYVCSEFVATILTLANIYDFNKKPEFVKPQDFNTIPNIKKIYEGKFLNARQKA